MTDKHRKDKQMRFKARYVIFAVLFLIFIYYFVQVMYARSHTVETAKERLSQITIEKDDLSQRQLEIFIRVQDPNFYNHRGVEFRTPGSGLTTITQSLAKKFYFRDFKQGVRKIKQTLCARFALHPKIPKDRQITLFLNMMYFGNDQWGIDDAARYYYSKNVNELDEDEFISLIGCLIAPVNLNVKDHPEKNRDRVEKIKRMLSGEYVPKGLLDITYDKR